MSNADVWADLYVCCGAGNGARTDSNGDYLITGLPAGQYRVQTRARSDATLAGEFYSSTQSWDDATPVTVITGTTTAGVDFDLDAGGSISGTITDDAGNPLADVDVWADTFACCGGGNGARSGSDGTYTITGLAPDDYRVQVDATRLGYTREFYSSTAEWDRALRVTVAAGTTTQPVDFKLAAGGSISGIVTDSGGTPIGGAEVWANTVVCCGGGNGDRTSLDGTYVIKGLAVGNYRVRANAAEKGFAHQFYTSTSDRHAATPVSVSSGTTTPDIDFALTSGGSIVGLVVRDSGGTVVSGAHVWAETFICCSGGNGARTDAQGEFEVAGLPAGSYRLHVDASGPGVGPRLLLQHQLLGPGRSHYRPRGGFHYQVRVRAGRQGAPSPAG